MAYNDFLRYSQEEIDFPSSRSKRFGIDDHTGKHIGNCMYYDIDTRRHETELGIMIGDRAYWSKGYGTDAVDTLLKYIFTQTNMKRVYLHTLDWNQRAQKSFGKSGLSADQASAQARLGLHPDGDTTPRMGGYGRKEHHRRYVASSCTERIGNWPSAPITNPFVPPNMVPSH